MLYIVCSVSYNMFVYNNMFIYNNISYHVFISYSHILNPVCRLYRIVDINIFYINYLPRSPTRFDLLQLIPKALYSLYTHRLTHSISLHLAPIYPDQLSVLVNMFSDVLKISLITSLGSNPACSSTSNILPAWQQLTPHDAVFTLQLVPRETASTSCCVPSSIVFTPA